MFVLAAAPVIRRCATKDCRWSNDRGAT